MTQTLPPPLPPSARPLLDWQRVPIDLALGALTLLGLVPGLVIGPARLGFLFGGVQAVLGLIATLWLPGYLLTLCLFPTRQSLRRLERVALSLAMSVTFVSLLCLVVSRIGLGMRPGPLLGGSVLWFLTTALLSRLRLQSLPPENRYELRLGDPDVRLGAKIALALLLGMLVLLGSLQILRGQTVSTELYATGTQGQMQDYTTRAIVGQPLLIPLRLTVQAKAPLNFTLRSSTGEKLDIGPLQPGQTWSGSISVTPGTPGPATVQLELTAQGHPEQRRNLELQFDVSSP